ncbi:DUF4251 domain-containing protein [Winogradskyella endarachnes]|uniref:DUF4251 domain-containing protein n=1 Tax=Winogradskyella endarachnes TaxID=2681965 RepID=A0A6L6U4W1_9FLAO|nr:DUF4251 domain-containing protein [Winogradskyella endarachnes]MUU77121.1 DUF4251 domain-containing protein [Winogradskyella endarachnes]
MYKNSLFKPLHLILVLVFTIVLWSCKSNSVSSSKTRLDDINKLQMLMDRDAYYIDIEVVYPLNTLATQQVANALLLSRTGNNASRIDVSGDGHFVQIKSDSVKGNLSFFGERRLSGGHYGGTNGGIVFNGLPKDYLKGINEKKRKLEIKFTTNQEDEISENYEVKIEIFPNNKVNVNIASTFKSFINYSGTLRDDIVFQ